MSGLLPLSWSLPDALDLKIDEVSQLLGSGYLDCEEAIGRLIDIGHTREAAEGRVDAWAQAVAW